MIEDFFKLTQNKKVIGFAIAVNAMIFFAGLYYSQIDLMLLALTSYAALLFGFVFGDDYKDNLKK